MIKFTPIIIFSIFIFLGGGCDYPNSSNKKSGDDERKDSWLSKSIIFPPMLKELDGEMIVDIDTASAIFDSRPRLISIIDATCAKCILMQMNQLDSIFAEIVDDQYRIFVLNVPLEDSVYFMHHYQPLVQVDGNILWDNGYHFESANVLFTTDIHKRTFMIDSQNQIVQVGNPLMNIDVMKKYKGFITQMIMD